MELAHKLILASASPRREMLLGYLGLPFEILPSAVEEVVDPKLSPSQVVTELACQKADWVAQSLQADKKIEKATQTIVIGADTIVVLDGKILGKPKTREDAIEMLTFLSGREHEVYTGVALVVLQNGNSQNIKDNVKSKVRFKQLNKPEIEAYVDTKEPMDKAGAYALQGTGAAFIEGIEGCYSNIIGLPIPTLVQMLRNLGVTVLGLDKIC